MAFVRRIVIALLALTLFAAGTARAASTTNFTDQWWNPAESGWGVSVLQQSDTLFVALFVYGTDSKAVWLTASAAYQSSSPTGHQVFTGDLNLTTGSYYGTTWIPGSVTYRKVGTLTFDATSGNAATLTYSVDGTPVTKSLTRQLWKYENLTGRYLGGSSGGDAGNRNSDLVTLDIVHRSDNSVKLTLWNAVDALLGGVYVSGTYTQSGHMGRIDGTLDPPDRGYLNFYEIEKTSSGLTARFEGMVNGYPVTNGRIGAVLR